jgi:hypothetical protein
MAITAEFIGVYIADIITMATITVIGATITAITAIGETSRVVAVSKTALRRRSRFLKSPRRRRVRPEKGVNPASPVLFPAPYGAAVFPTPVSLPLLITFVAVPRLYALLSLSASRPEIKSEQHRL